MFGPDEDRHQKLSDFFLFRHEITPTIHNHRAFNVRLHFFLCVSNGFEPKQRRKTPEIVADLPNAPPQARIVTPAGGKRYHEGEHLLLVGYALDLDGQRVPPEVLSWHLEGDDQRNLGEGEQVVYRETIPAGNYTIRLSVDLGVDATVDIEVIHATTD